ncbi:MAG: flagellar hook-basal body complex protein [Anaerotruncus colihominis]|uniref:flagellar hook protein FlgE n=1 Tax=Anaerotruncus colihominis TaxID=169435 RepID=UPI001D40B798|nr:flagellar hook-basal body complex protein [Anaerotruncus colihominis]MBS4988313.1 flagellar hook-basal body complex protein [Anaerotruncus colihominis]
MVRSMYSGVAGMKSHQQRMDVIGNNIANVNTYGFKSSRVTFRDMFYQNIRNASAGTSTRGGVSPSGIGYGSQIASIDKLMTQSSMTSTGQPLDCAITGDGFFQVQDSDGNIFYTRAGMLDIDQATGYLVDLNGYFVLGTQGPDVIGKAPGNSKIQVKLDPLEAAAGSKTETIQNVEYILSATNYTTAGNVNFNFSLDNEMPTGQNIRVVVDGNSIAVKVNPTAQFASLSAFMDEVNQAITDARGGVEHPAGLFTITADPEPAGPLTGEQIVNSDSGPTGGKIVFDGALKTGYAVKSYGSAFSASGKLTFEIQRTVPADKTTAPDNPSCRYTVTVTGQNAAGETVTYTLDELNYSQLTNSAGVHLVNGDNANDSIDLRIPSSFYTKNPGADPDDPADDTYEFPTGTLGTATPQTPSGNIGLGSKDFLLEGGTEGGPQSLMNLTGIAIGADGIIRAQNAGKDIIVGRIDLANFDNPQGLDQAGNSYFTATDNSGKAKYAVPGEDGTGALKNSTLEMSNVDLSQEFSDMIVTQRGFQANSRLITVSDTMLEELINLKR